jgi:hypothetical protein
LVASTKFEYVGQHRYTAPLSSPADLQTPTEFNLVIAPTNSTISPGGRIEDRKGASKTYLHLVASPAFLSHKRELMENPPPIYFDLSMSPFLIADKVLDRLVFGAIPESLLPVIGYACAVGLFAWLVVGKIAVQLIRLACRNSRLKEVNGGSIKIE